MNKKIFHLKIQLTAAVFLLIVSLISGFFIFGPELGRVARALSPNYSKTTTAPGNQLSATEWNNLPADFLARTGGNTSAMQGVLDMGNNRITNLTTPTSNNDATTKQYVDNQTINANFLQILSGSLQNARIVCGRTTPGSTGWQQYDNTTVQANVNTAAANFSNTPYYIISLGGSGNHYRTYGSSSVYSPSITGFTVYVTRINQTNTPGESVNVEAMSAAQAESWQWHINWCGVVVK